MGGERIVEAEGIYYPMLQIWRFVDKGAYISSQSTSLLSYDSGERANIHVVKANPPLRVEEGDILGIYQPPESSIVVYYQEASGPINLAMDRVFSSTSSGPAPTSVFGLVTAEANDWPLITVEFISEYRLLQINHSLVITGDATSSLTDGMPLSVTGILLCQMHVFMII